MAYADFAYYTDSYGGTAVSSAVEFARLAAKASAYLDKVTLGRAAEHADNELLKNCCCEICDTYKWTSDSGGMIKQSESVGSWSYSLNSASADKTVENAVYTVCRAWLPADWLYKGVGRE